MSLTSFATRAGAGVLVSGFLMFGLVGPQTALASCSNGGQDSGNDVIYCGAFTKAALQDKIQNGDGMHSAADIQNILFNAGHATMSEVMSSDTVNGTVYRNGNVVVNQNVLVNGQIVFHSGDVVATNAWSVGRDQNGSSTKFTSDTWRRPTNTSFLQNSIGGFINMSGGKFHFFILNVCGNFGGGTAVVKPIPKPTPKPTPVPTMTPMMMSPSPSPSPTPSPTCTCTPSPTPTEETESPSPSPTGQVLGVSTNLPQTGPEDLLGGAAGLTAIGYAGRAYLRSRKNFLASFKNKIDKQ